MYELTDAMVAKSKLPGYAGAMAACWETTAAALEAQALRTLWHIEIASEPGGKEDEAMVQRNCGILHKKKRLRSLAANAYGDAAGSQGAAIAEWRAEVDDSDASWVDWPGGARYSTHDGHTWGEECAQAWLFAEAAFGVQLKILKPFCTLCHQAHEEKESVLPVEIVSSSEITAYEGI